MNAKMTLKTRKYFYCGLFAAMFPHVAMDFPRFFNSAEGEQRPTMYRPTIGLPELFICGLFLDCMLALPLNGPDDT